MNWKVQVDLTDCKHRCLIEEVFVVALDPLVTAPGASPQVSECKKLKLVLSPCFGPQNSSSSVYPLYSVFLSFFPSSFFFVFWQSRTSQINVRHPTIPRRPSPLQISPVLLHIFLDSGFDPHNSSIRDVQSPHSFYHGFSNGGFVLLAYFIVELLLDSVLITSLFFFFYLSSSSMSLSHSSSVEVAPKCRCGNGDMRLFTSHTKANPNRKSWGCPKWIVSGIFSWGSFSDKIEIMT